MQNAGVGLSGRGERGSDVGGGGAFANDPGRKHRPSWLRYFKESYESRAAGIWHETYVVPAGSYETVYGNMPLLGLGTIAGVQPATGHRNTAA